MAMKQPGAKLPSQAAKSRLPSRAVVGGYVLLGLLLAYTLISRHFLPLYLADDIAVERAAADPAFAKPLPAADTRIDPNTAGWTELTRLPRIGEVIAKRIVAHREEHQARPGEPVFRCVEDLQRVKGIGPKTIELIRDQVRFPDAAEPSLAQPDMGAPELPRAD